MAAKTSGFKLYDVLVRLGGSRYNEVRKSGVTAPEIMLLGSIHGPDSISESKAIKQTAKRTDKEERARLVAEFEGGDVAKRGFVQRVFGPSTMPLPKELDGDCEPREQVDVQVIPPHLADKVEPHAALVG